MLTWLGVPPALELREKKPTKRKRKNGGTALSFHIQTWWEEKPQFPSLSHQSFGFGVQVLLPPCRLPAVPQVIHAKSLCVPAPQCHIPKISLSQEVPVFPEDGTRSPEWDIPGMESGKLAMRQQTVLSPEHRARELCSRFLGKDRDALW